MLNLTEHKTCIRIITSNIKPQFEKLYGTRIICHGLIDTKFRNCKTTYKKQHTIKDADTNRHTHTQTHKPTHI